MSKAGSNSKLDFGSVHVTFFSDRQVKLTFDSSEKPTAGLVGVILITWSAAQIATASTEEKMRKPLSSNFTALKELFTTATNKET